LRKFPLSIFYSIERDGLLILAVAHQRRRARYWVSRLILLCYKKGVPQ